MGVNNDVFIIAIYESRTRMRIDTFCTGIVVKRLWRWVRVVAGSIPTRCAFPFFFRPIFFTHFVYFFFPTPVLIKQLFSYPPLLLILPEVGIFHEAIIMCGWCMTIPPSEHQDSHTALHSSTMQIAPPDQLA